MRGQLALILGMAALATPTAQAQQAEALRTASLAATCAACHGTEGRAVREAAIPGLAGMPAPYLREQMHAFQRGTRPGSVMPQLAKGYSEAQIDGLAAYFAQRPAAR